MGSMRPRQQPRHVPKASTHETELPHIHCQLYSSPFCKLLLVFLKLREITPKYVQSTSSPFFFSLACPHHCGLPWGLRGLGTKMSYTRATAGPSAPSVWASSKPSTEGSP